jgi:hypothetical protein
MTGLLTHDGAAVKVRTMGNRTRTEPGRNLTDWPIQHNQFGCLDASYTGSFPNLIPSFCLRLKGSLFPADRAFI